MANVNPRREEVDDLVHQLRNLMCLRVELDAEIESLKDQVKEIMGDLMELRGPDYKILYTPVSQSRIDTKLLSATYPEIARECTKTISYRRFEVK